MRMIPRVLMLAASAMAVPALSMASMSAEHAIVVAGANASRAQTRNHRRSGAQSAYRVIRSRSKMLRSKRRPNRLHISRRTRRKHRRSA